MSACADVESPPTAGFDPEDISELSESKVPQCEELVPNISPACRTYFPNIAKAVEWLRMNKKLFKYVVKEPTVIGMTEEDIVKIIEERVEHSYSIIDDWHRPTSFLFADFHDLELFLDKVRHEQDCRIDCEMLE